MYIYKHTHTYIYIYSRNYTCNVSKYTSREMLACIAQHSSPGRNLHSPGAPLFFHFGSLSRFRFQSLPPHSFPQPQPPQPAMASNGNSQDGFVSNGFKRQGNPTWRVSWCFWMEGSNYLFNSCKFSKHKVIWGSRLSVDMGEYRGMFWNRPTSWGCATACTQCGKSIER